jgi:hypothetical protein
MSSISPTEESTSSGNDTIDTTPCKRPARAVRRWKGLRPIHKFSESQEDHSESNVLDRAIKEVEVQRERLWQIDQVRMMRLTLPEDEGPEGELVPGHELVAEDELLEVAAQLGGALDHGSEASIRGMIVADEDEDSELAKQLRAEILKEFEGRVFRPKVRGNPPIRGTHGGARLYLKAGATPICGRLISLHGERLEALQELEDAWKRDGKLETGHGPWRTAAFPIRKKGNKWRGVVDYSKTNQQLQDDQSRCRSVTPLSRIWATETSSSRWS